MSNAPDTSNDEPPQVAVEAGDAMERYASKLVNPKRGRGRPPKVARSVAPRQFRRDVIAIGEMTTIIQTADGPKKVTLAQAMLWRTATKAVNGHGPCLRFYLNLYEKMLLDHAAANPKVFELLEWMETETFAHQKETSTPLHTKTLNDHRRGTRWV